MKFEKSQKEGDEAQDLFIEVAQARGYKVDKAPDYIDMYDHIDLFLEKNGAKATVDVKNWKRTGGRHGPIQDENVYIEFKNVGGYRGWIYGEADLIAFRRKAGFMLVDRVKLLKYCTSVIDPTSYASSPTLYKMYRRHDRPKEAVSLITYDEIPKEIYYMWSENDD